MDLGFCSKKNIAAFGDIRLTSHVMGRENGQHDIRIDLIKLDPYIFVGL